MFEHDNTTCSMELDPNRRPHVSLDVDFSQLHNGLLDFTGSTDYLGMNTGIEATDVGSLLEQFEEASNSIDCCDLLQPTVSFDKMTNFDLSVGKPEEEPKETSSGRSTPTTNVLSKIRSSNKRKTTILLPMGMPSKRGRGKAVTMPTKCAPPKLQKIMTQISRTVDQEAAKDMEQFTIQPKDKELEKPCTSKQIMNEEEKVNVDYYSSIIDHDYCVNVHKPEHDKTCVSDISNSVVNFQDSTYPVEVILDLEDGEVLDIDESDKENKEKEDTSKSNSLLFPDKLKQAHSKRNYRKRDGSPEALYNEKYFDKIPSYYTALSVNVSKPPKKDKDISRNGISVQDYFEPNPTPLRDDSVYSKLPDYYSCFTNSTKYDNSENMDKDVSLENSQDSRGSSGYSSRCQSPLVMNMDDSPSYSNSRSRDCRRRGRRSKRSRSFDSSSSRSRSRSSSDSFSSRSRSRSSSYDYSSRSRSRSRSPVRSERGGRSTSWERLKQERKKQREEEKSQQIEERRIVYVGKIPNDYTRRQLRKRFGRFGEIEEVSVHFREHRDNYGFVTFAYTCDAYAAVEKGNAIPGEEVFDLCFGGRRQFCEVEYADLDGNNEIEEEYYPLTKKPEHVDFDELLQQAKKSTSKRN